MFQRITNSWELAKSSWKVLLADKELCIFPIISMVGMIVVSASFLIPTILTGLLDHIHDGDPASKVFGFFVLFAFYVVTYTVIFYCNSALVGCALIRLRGGNPTLNDGFIIANSQLQSIVGYALIASTVGIFLQWLRDRGILGKFAAGFFGLAWNIATFLVVPILVTENIGPIDAVKRSTTLMKKTWGESIVGNVGISLVFGYLILATILIGTFLFLMLSGISMVLAVLIAIAAVLTIASLSIISFALTGIYSAAVYHYATTGQADGYFDKNQIMSAFKPK